MLEAGFLKPHHHSLLKCSLDSMTERVEKPDVVLFLYADVETCWERIQKRARAGEYEHITKQYLTILHKHWTIMLRDWELEHPETMLYIIDASQPADAVAQKVVDSIREYQTIVNGLRPKEGGQTGTAPTADDKPVVEQHMADFSPNSDSDGYETGQDTVPETPTVKPGGFIDLTVGRTERSNSPSIDPDLPCEICLDPDDDSEMILCDECYKGYHMYCLEPRLTGVPAGKWFCPTCKGKQPKRYLPPTVTTQPPSLLPSVTQLPSTRVEPTKKTKVTPTEPPPGNGNADADSGDDADDGDAAYDIYDDLEVLEWLRSHTLPEKGSMTSQDFRKKIQRIRRRAELYDYNKHTHDLYKKASGRYSTRRIPPKEERSRIIQQLHNHLSHGGIQKMRTLITSRFYWRGMFSDIQDYVRTCEECQKKTAKFKLNPELQPLPPTPIFHRFAMDTVGPFPTSASGNKYIIVAVEYYTRWVEAWAVPDRTAKTTAKFLMEEVIARFGRPEELITDNGSEFQGPFHRLMRKWDIVHRLTSPYHPQANGLVERTNQTLTRALTSKSLSHPHLWDTHLPEILLGMRAAQQESVGYSPFYLLYGREARLPGEITTTMPQPQAAAADGTVTAGPSNTADHTAANPTIEFPAPKPVQLMDRAAEMNNTAKAATTNLLQAQEKQKQKYNKRRNIDMEKTDTQLPEGALVWMKKRRTKDKLDSGVEGPYILAGYRRDAGTSSGQPINRALLRDHQGQTWAVHVREIAPYHPAATPTATAVTPNSPATISHRNTAGATTPTNRAQPATQNLPTKPPPS